MKSRNIISIAAVALIWSWFAAASEAQQMDRRRESRMAEIPTITVSGTGEVMAKPDQAVLRLGATAQADTAEEAQEEVNEIVARAIEDIRELDISEDNIQTARIMLSPVYAGDPPRGPQEAQEPRIAAYRASNTLEIRLDDLSQIGPVIDAGVKAGANEIENVSFRLKDDVQARSQALRRAVGDARAKADAIAEAMGVGLGRVTEVRESGVSSIPPQYDIGQFSAARMETGTPVQPGEMSVQASVVMSFGIEQAAAQRPARDRIRE